MLPIIYNALISALLVLSGYRHERQILAGGIVHKGSLIAAQFGLTAYFLGPLFYLYPGAFLTTIAYLVNPTVLLVGGFAWYWHKKTVDAQSEGLPEPTMRWWQRLIVKIHQSVGSVCFGVYLASLIALAPVLPAYTITAFSFFLVDTLYRKGYLPKILCTAYEKGMLAFVLVILTNMACSVLGITVGGGFSLVIFAALAVHTAWLYLTTNVFKTKSKYNAYPEQKKDKTLHAKDKPYSEVLTKLKMQDTQLTYNHFSAVEALEEKNPAPDISFDELQKLFDKIDFNVPDTKNDLRTYVLDDQGFATKTLDERKQEFNLSATATDLQVYEAYVKSNIKVCVQTLKAGVPEESSLVAAAALQRKAKFVAQYLVNHFAEEPQRCVTVLLRIAVNTGTKCNIAYGECFGNLYQTLIVPTLPALTLKERAVLAAQAVRVNCFKKYYNQYVNVIEQFVNRQVEIVDTADMHNYEDFVLLHPQLYLENAFLECRTKTIFDIISEKINWCSFTALKFITTWMLQNPVLVAQYGPQAASRFKFQLFPEHYTVEAMVNQVLLDTQDDNAFFSLWEDWCQQQGGEIKVQYDTIKDVRGSGHEQVSQNGRMQYRQFNKLQRNEKAQQLALLMLLDLEIIQLKQPVATYFPMVVPVPGASVTPVLHEVGQQTGPGVNPHSGLRNSLQL